MRKEEITISGTIEFEGEEYDYTAILRDPCNDARPSEVTDIDCADGSPVPDEVDFEALEELAMKNAELLDWCARNGWDLEDTGGYCTAFIKQEKPGLVRRATRTNDPSVPQTLYEPVIIGMYDDDDLGIGPITTLSQGMSMLIDGRSNLTK